MTMNRLNKYLMITSAVCIFTAGVPALAQAQYSDSSAAAAAEIRFQQLEKEIRRLTGQVEEQGYEIRSLRDALEKSRSEYEARLKALEGGSSTSSQSNNVQGGGIERDEPSAPTTAQGSGQTLGTINQSQDGSVSQSASDNAPRDYDFAYSFIKARDFSRAEVEFEKFMKNYPNHALISNAKYWYAETFYVRGEYEKSARIFAEGYQSYPKSSKAASNLLKLGMSLVGMKKPNDACIAFKQLKKDYSKSSVPVLKRADSEMEKINCR